MLTFAKVNLNFGLISGQIGVEVPNVSGSSSGCSSFACRPPVQYVASARQKSPVSDRRPRTAKFIYFPILQA